MKTPLTFDDLMLREMGQHTSHWLDGLQDVKNFRVARAKNSLQLEHYRKGTGWYSSSIYIEDLPKELQTYSLDEMLKWLLDHGAKLTPKLAGMEDWQDRTKHKWRVTLEVNFKEYVFEATTINPEEARDEAKKQAKKLVGSKTVRFRTKSIEDLGEVK